FAMPTNYPDHLEPGTLAGPSIAALGAGVEFINRTGADIISAHELSLSAQFRSWCRSKSWIKVAGATFQNSSQDTGNVALSPIVSLVWKNLD
ncbi:hypothetical protein ACSTJG_24390, partial [Vibrio parahaemolyticus]